MLAYRPTLRVAIAVPFALLFATAVGLQALTEHQQVNALIDRSSVRLLDMLTNSSAKRLSDYLEEPFRIQRDVGAAIARQTLYRPGDLSSIYLHIRSAYHDSYKDLQQISVIGFGSRAGEYVGLRREDSTTGLALMLKDSSTKGQLTIYKGDGPGQVAASFADYDPRLRPWYTPVAESGQSRWSDIYTNFDERSGITISATSPVKAGDGLLGVMAVDIKLDGLSRFLRDELIRGKGAIVITDTQGRLVAQSDVDSVVSNGKDGNRRGERLLMSQSASAVIRAAAEPVARAFLDTEVDFHLHVDDQPYYGRVTPFNDVRGLHWRIVALVPESDLMGDARLVSQRVMLWILGLSALGLCLGLWVVSWVTQPLYRTAQAANRLALGQGDVGISQSGWLRETSILVGAFNDMAQRLQQSFGELREQVIYDNLTGLLTRRGLLEQAQWSGSRQAAIALIGLDGFRAINDKVGYGTGDHLLQAIAQRFQESFAAPVLVARVSGDEFALLQFEINGDPSIWALGERALTLFATPFSFGADEVTVSASAGLVQGLLETQALSDWLRNASVALGEAKRRGQGRCVRFEADMMAQFLARAQLINELRQALEQEQFLVYFQPVVHLATGRVTGAEALLRWQSPQRGMVSPGVFIPLAEESELILALGDWVLRSATRQMAQQLSQLPADFELHVNLSPRQLIQSDFVSNLLHILDDSAYPASKLTLELTESQLIDPGQPIEERLQAIRAMGVKIAIDDFGTGYSSLAYLSRLPFNCLKIDQSFVRKLSSSRPDAAIVQAVLHMAKGLGVQVVAEGVETLLEARLLHQMGCGYVQGFYFARPTLLAHCDWQDRKAISAQ